MVCNFGVAYEHQRPAAIRSSLNCQIENARDANLRSLIVGRSKEESHLRPGFELAGPLAFRAVHGLA
jgi:hypothetical protein